MGTESSAIKATELNTINAISPMLEIGAYEALWNDEVSSFKQVRDKLLSKNASFASEVVPNNIAIDFYRKIKELLKEREVETFGVRIDGTADYPNQLLDVKYPLLLLYFRGCWSLVLRKKRISIVGTRNPSYAGKQRAKRLTKELVDLDFTIFSGLAKGIDTIAHRTAIENGGRTVAVIGTPLSHTYPKENAVLQEEIAQNHLLISQVPILRYEKDGPQFNRFYFPERNKTMSALSEATIIVEAGDTSGTLIQAKAAIDQGRKLFVLESCFKSPNLLWPSKFKNKFKEKVILVQGIEDILREFD